MPFDNTPDTISAATVLRGVIELLNDPNNWVKGVRSFTVRGHTAYCAIGALETVGNRATVYDFPLCYLERAAIQYGYTGIVECNDAAQTTHADLMKVLHTAVTLAEQGEY